MDDKHLLYTCFWLAALLQGSTCVEWPRFDGWKNNINQLSMGSVGDDIYHYVPGNHAKQRTRPKIPELVDKLFNNKETSPSKSNRTALFVYFGQYIERELVNTEQLTCPIEFRQGSGEVVTECGEGGCDLRHDNIYAMPQYNTRNLCSPNSPKTLINHATSWIDGSAIYGTNILSSDHLRQLTKGLLKETDDLFPVPDIQQFLDFGDHWNYMENEGLKTDALWSFGDTGVHENPGLLSIALVWYRWHNILSRRLYSTTKHTTDEHMFKSTRKWVVAHLQKTVVYEWLPALLNRHAKEYTGYNPSTNGRVSAEFAGCAIKSLLTLVPSHIHLRNINCAYNTMDAEPIRLCNSYWNAQELIETHGLVRFILGLTSQLAEKEDMNIVEDVLDFFHGPSHNSRRRYVDLVIALARDSKISNYDKVRKLYGFPPIETNDNGSFVEINREKYKIQPDLLDLYDGRVDAIELLPGMLEEVRLQESFADTLVVTVVEKQLYAIRDADRFWFENLDNGLFTEEEIMIIKNTTFKDILMATLNISSTDLPDNVFLWRAGDPCEAPAETRQLEDCATPNDHDHFSGSEISFIVTIFILVMVPLAIIVLAFVVVQCSPGARRASQVKRVTKPFAHKSLRKTLNYELKSGQSFYVMEWRGKDEEKRRVKLFLDYNDAKLKIYKGAESLLRRINFGQTESVQVIINKEIKNSYLILKVPKEYDMVVEFSDDMVRDDFVNELEQVLDGINKQLHVTQQSLKTMLKEAVTQLSRQKMLERFFRQVFTEDENDINEKINKDEMMDGIECELSKAEFAEALALKPGSLFVDQLFAIIDKDDSGYISFKELSYALVIFSKGSSEDKVKLLFNIYDTDKSGTLDRGEIKEMVKSLLEMANSKLSVEEEEQFINAMFNEAGLTGQDVIDFNGFGKMLAKHMDKFSNTELDFKGAKTGLGKNVKSAGKAGKGRKKQHGEGGAATSLGFISKEKYSPLRAHLKYISHYLENNKRQIAILTLYIGISLLVFAERFYAYQMEKSHIGMSQLVGIGLAFSRGSAAALCFSFAVLLLTMCRNCITKLRSTSISFYVPFDDFVSFHKFVAYCTFVFMMIHVAGHLSNFYHLTTQPVEFLCFLKEIVFSSNNPPTFHYFVYMTPVGLTGVLIYVIMWIMYLFASQLSRRTIYNAFWTSHKMFFIIYILTIMHGAGRLLQTPWFPYYITGPAVLLVIDRTISISRKKVKLDVLEAELLPSNVTSLKFKRPDNFEYKSGMWIRLACPNQGKDEYHPFTLTSAPHEDWLSVHVRGIGPWTLNLRKTYDPAKTKGTPLPKVEVDGPFGAGQQDWYMYEVAVLVGGGIGVTPYASILKDFSHIMSKKQASSRIRCQKVYFIWVTNSHHQFEWLIDILRHVEDTDKRNVVSIHCFITQFFHKFDLRTTMLYICEEQFKTLSQRSIFTGLRGATHFGRPQFDKIFGTVCETHTGIDTVGVFSCGPVGLTKTVERACHDMGKVGRIKFEHHYENF